MSGLTTPPADPGDVVAPSPRRRPQALGRALAPFTWEHTDPSFPKLREVIEVIDPNLTLLDRKVWDVLLHVSYDGLYQNPYQVFQAPAADIRRAVGWEQHRSNREIEESLERLQRTLVVIGYMAEGRFRRRKINLLVMSDMPPQDGVVYWRFAPDLAPLLGAPSQWARIHLKVISRFTSGYGIRLYELLSLYANRHEPVWDVTVEDLRDLLGAVGKTFTNWAQFWRKALKPALDEVNAYASYRAECEPVKAQRSRRIERVIFTIARLEEAPASPRRVLGPGRTFRDARTPDFEDGRTDAERGSRVPQTAAGLAARIGPRSREALQVQYPSLDITALIEDWARWSAEKGEQVRRPKLAFEAWLRLTRGAQITGAASGALPQPPDDLRAFAAMADLNVMQRQSWLNIALSKHPQVKVPNLSREYFHLWVPLIAAELVQAGMC